MVELEPLESRLMFSGVSHAAAHHASHGLNLLFFGNSFTMYNDLTLLVSDIAVAAGHPVPHVRVQAGDGWSFANDLAVIGQAGQNNIINSGLRPGSHWDDVILQDLSTEPTDLTAPPVSGNANLFRRDASKLFSMVHRSSPGVHGVLFETWARGALNPFYPGSFLDPDAMQSQLSANYALEAHDLNRAFGHNTSQVASVGEAWRAMAWDRSLYSGSDEYHPSPRGSMLAALVLYSNVYGQPSTTIPAASVSTDLTRLGLTADDWTQLTQVATTVAMPG